VAGLGEIFRQYQNNSIALYGLGVETEKGKRTKTCSVCKKTETEEIAARGHTYTTYTDNKDGKQHTKTCDVCNNAIVENHTFGTAGTAIKCTLCGAANPNDT